MPALRTIVAMCVCEVVDRLAVVRLGLVGVESSGQKRKRRVHCGRIEDVPLRLPQIAWEEDGARVTDDVLISLRLDYDGMDVCVCYTATLLHVW